MQRIRARIRAPKGQKLLTQGSALGFVVSENGALKGQKH
jgi:hypothetical protein